MNVFETIKQYNKNSFSTYGDILENNLNSDNGLSKTEKELYNQIKLGDIKRFKISENRNLINNQNINRSQKEIPGIGMVTQIC